MDVRYDEAKFAELLVLVAGRLQTDRSGGATKLNKVLFFADFTHVRRRGRPITGAEYQKLPHGPAPRRLLPVRARLLRDGQVELVRDQFLGREVHRLVPRRPADLSVFTDDERETVDLVLSDLAGMTAAQVSELSHEEPGWRLVDEGETIPYAAALLGYPQNPTATSKELERSVAELYGLLGA
jgi:hypothetical protein